MLENPFKRRALTDDLIEVARKLFLEIELLLGQRCLLLGQLILQLGDLVKGLRVVDGQGDLVGHLPEQSEVQKAPPLISHKLGGRGLVRARRAQGAEHPTAADQGQPAPGLHSRLEQVLNFPTLEALRIDAAEHQRLPFSEHPTFGRPFQGQERLFAFRAVRTV